MLSVTREAGCFREVAALHSDHLRQVPLYVYVHMLTYVWDYSMYCDIVQETLVHVNVDSCIIFVHVV